MTHLIFNETSPQVLYHDKRKQHSKKISLAVVGPMGGDWEEETDFGEQYLGPCVDQRAGG